MYAYYYDHPLHISHESLDRVHAVPFAFMGPMELFIDSKHRHWVLQTHTPLDPTAWYRPKLMPLTMLAKIESLTEPPKFWIQRQVVQGPQAHTLMISGAHLTSIAKLPLENFWHETADGWLRIVLQGPAKKIRPQADGLIEVAITSNSRSIADQVAHYLAAKVVTVPKTTLAYSSELPRLMRPPIGNATYFPHRAGVLNRIAADKRSLCSHVLISGTAGSGKTNTMLNILEQCVNIPGLCVIDPFDNFKGWASKHAIKYLAVGRNPSELAYLNCNPLVCPERMRLGSHLDLLSDLLACAVSGGGGSTLPFYVRKVLNAFYRDMWSLDEQQFRDILNETGARLRQSPHFRLPNQPLAQMTMWWQHNRDTLIQNIFAGNPAGDLGNLKHILHSRIAELVTSFLNHFNYRVHRGLDGLFDQRVVVSLQGCSSSEADLIMGTLSTYYVSTALLRDPADQLQNLLALDEAHRVMARAKPGSSEFKTIGETLGKTMGTAIRELRSRGVGCLLADQDATQLPEEAQSTTGIQMYHRTSGAVILKFLETLLAGSPVDLPALETGSAICKFLGDPITVESLPLWRP